LFRAEGIVRNGLWLRATVATTAVEFALGGEDDAYLALPSEPGRYGALLHVPGLELKDLCKARLRSDQ
jgi:hypothetical protein